MQWNYAYILGLSSGHKKEKYIFYQLLIPRLHEVWDLFVTQGGQKKATNMPDDE